MENLKKKRKVEDTANKEIRSLVEDIPKPQLVDLLTKLGSQDLSIAEEIKTIAAPYTEIADRKISVSGLAITDSFALYHKFQEYGEIEEAVVFRDKATGNFKGYGFVTYKDSQSVNNALRDPNKFINGVPVACRLDDDGQRLSLRKLYIGNLPPITNENLRVKFQMHGEIEEAVAYKNQTGERKNGYGFVTYKTAEAAKMAIDYNILHERNMIVRYADSQTRPHFPGWVASRAVPPMNPAPGYVQPENSDVNYGAPNGYTCPETTAVLPYAAPPYPQTAAALPYAAPPYQTNGQGPYPRVSAGTNQFEHQYYYNYPNPNQ